MPFESEVSISQTCGAPAIKPCCPSKLNALGARLPDARAPHAGDSAVWGSGLSLLWENNTTFFQFVGHPRWGGGI